MTGAEAASRDVFISYSTADEALITRIAERLTEREVKVWYAPIDIREGELFARRLEEGLRTSQAVVAFISPSALNSFWAELEWNASLVQMSEDRTRRLIPVLLRDVALDQVPLFLRTLDYLDFRGADLDDPATLEKKADTLLRSIRGDCTESAESPAGQRPTTMSGQGPQTAKKIKTIVPLIAAGMTACAMVVAALIGIVPPMLESWPRLAPSTSPTGLPAPTTAPASPQQRVAVDIYPSSTACHPGSAWSAELRVRVTGGDGIYTYYTDGVWAAGPTGADVTIPLRNNTCTDLRGKVTVESAGQFTSQDYFIRVPPCCGP